MRAAAQCDGQTRLPCLNRGQFLAEVGESNQSDRDLLLKRKEKEKEKKIGKRRKKKVKNEKKKKK